eukprot:508750-Pleurochrysis_carterae.AAC.3
MAVRAERERGRPSEEAQRRPHLPAHTEKEKTKRKRKGRYDQPLRNRGDSTSADDRGERQKGRCAVGHGKP